MKNANERIVARILDSPQLSESDVRALEHRTGAQLLSRITPMPGMPQGVVVYDASVIRKLLEAGLLVQTR